ncbi:unnamed protein product [Ceratitis capitata]|uniref:(Mediterranean fruit fly) hypothetical protein n=2 Tax=Ceratitis capitata TaxID=7213 RepID=A0A811V059_CERCA|nr:unnamed protein product [Ceratitis capitata]
MSIDFKDNNLARNHSGIVLRSSESLNDRKAKSALRIIVTLAPSYLAYVTLGNEKINKSADVLDELSDIQQNKIIKYYDRLSQIPISNVPTCISERQLYHSSHRSSRRKTASKNYTSTTHAPIKTVATSTTRLLQSEDMATPYRNVNASSLSTHAVRASAIFANAMSALGTVKINPPEDST